MMNEKFGPFTDDVNAFITSLNSVPWFTRVGEAEPEDVHLVRVCFEELARCSADPYELWGEKLLESERQLQQMIVTKALLSEQDRVQASVHIRGDHIDSFLIRLDEKYPEYYDETFRNPHEEIILPERLVRNAAYEVMVGKEAAQNGFFFGLMSWFWRGHFPVGWQGGATDGRLILW